MTKRKTKALEVVPSEEEKPDKVLEAVPLEEDELDKALEALPLEEEKPSAVVPKQAPYLGLTRNEMTWAALAHASILLTLVVGPATGGLGAIFGVMLPPIIWYAHRGKSEYVVNQARQATIFQLAGIVGLGVLVVGGGILLAVAWLVSIPLVLVLVGLVLLPLVLILTLLWGVAVVALPIMQVVYGCYAAVETYNGRPFRYRWVADLMDQYLAKA